MSILIKGMEMPTGNDELRLIIHSNGQVIISHKTHYEEAEAVPVPPHGRLIDADELFRNIKAECNPYGNPTIGYEDGLKVLRIIENSPTIIPAEEAEE